MSIPFPFPFPFLLLFLEFQCPFSFPVAPLRYYAIIFLNQTILTNKEIDVAGKLLDVYFSVYRLLMSKGEVDTKMLSALLTGINRAFPFAKGASTSK